MVDAVPTFLESRNGEFWLEVTMNHPRVASWENLTTTKQNSVYLKKLHLLKNCLGIDNLELLTYSYEISKDGHTHCHALFHSTSQRTHFPLGVIGDVVKTYLSTLTKKYSNYKRHCMYEKYYRYNGAGICVQYRFPHEHERVAKWEAYIKKYQ